MLRLRHTLPFLLLSLASHAENLLRNPRFEEEGGWNIVGSAWSRNKWRSHDQPGRYTAALLGGWATKGRSGEIRQQHIPANAGDYTLTAWVWIDFGWQTTDQYMEIEFLDESGLHTVSSITQIEAPLKEWTRITLPSTAPSNTASATVRVFASNISDLGSLAVDDVCLTRSEIQDP